MPATDAEPASMEDPHALEDEEGSSTNIPVPAPPTTSPSLTPLDPTTTRPNNPPTVTIVEKKAVSMASNDCSSALSSPAEASPAKPAATSPTTIEGTVEASQATSHIASASDSLICTGGSIVNISESPLTLSELPSTTYGSRGLGNNFPTVLTFKGVSVTLENNNVWKQFYNCGTEMILTKPGRRMFPYCRYRLTGLDPDRRYSLVLSIVPSDQYRYRWSTSKWEINGPAEHQGQGLIRAFSHHYSPSRGSEWMGSLVSFYKLKLTNHYQDQDGHIILHSMHRYIPRLHVIPVLDGDAPTPDKPVVMGPESMTFTFPQTEFMAVTTYQNFRITQLKINHNPFAKGFREDGHNPRLNRITVEAQPVVRKDTLPAVLKPAELEENKEVENLSVKNPIVPASPSNEQETRLVLKPIMSTSSTKDEPYVPCIRGKHALGELVLVQQRPLVKPREETHAAVSMTPTSSVSTPGSFPGYRKKKKRINRCWANSRGSMWKAAAVSPTVHHSPSLTVAMQPELDDVEGLLFVSFPSKEALEVHVGDKPASSTPSASPVSLTTQMQWKEKVEAIPETDEEKIARLEAILLQDLRLLKYRQAIHPVLQEVGLKLSSLDPTKSIDLRYLGVHLPLPPPHLPEQGNATALSQGDEGLSFISRTGKTSDMTKIKGWRNKFIRSKETSPNCDGSQKNLSAFCSNMLDEYLESEAQYISERADAFSTQSEGSVAYQLPLKSSSYVKTLDSVLKHRKAAAKSPVEANRPCPLSYKPLLYSALASPAPPLAGRETSETPVQAGAKPIQQSASPLPQPAAQRLPTYQPAVSQRPAVSFGQSNWMAHRQSGFSKSLLKLLQMEFGALNQGLRRTQLTPDRLSVALSGLLTKQMLPSQVSKVAHCPKYKLVGPECGQEFCALGCVCSSLQRLNRAPFHCRRPECMFGCGCFRRKITKQLSVMETDPIQPVYSMINMEHLIQPHPGAHAKKLWNRDIDDVDPEPVFIPKSAPLCIAPVKVLKRCSAPHPMQPIREEDKDPVYKYLESLMTCARVREFNSKPPPELTIEPKIIDAPPPNTTAKPQKTTTDNMPKKYFRTVVAVKKTAENPSQGTAASEKEAKKQIEIQSACQWAKDRKMVLEALCQRLSHNRLSRRFWVGPYFIRPVSKIFMRKPSGSTVIYRIHISKPSKASDHDEDESDDSDDERHASKSFDGDMDAQEDDGQIQESHAQFGVTPFLSGVTPAGRLRARTKPVGCQAYGLIQVNGKSYNQARLLLGNMGSLHPANRLAAFVTGRLRPGGISLKITPKSNSTNKITAPGSLLIKPPGTAVPPVITARNTTDLKPPVQLLQPDFWKNLLQQNLPTDNPFALGQRSSVSPFQNSSTSSPVSLTVSPSLKTPSFLGQSGTYSFRICPPANQSTRGQNLPGVTLPGGFTLIELPNPGAASKSVNTAHTAVVDKAQSQKDALFNVGPIAANSDANLLGLNTLTAAKDLSSSRPVEPGSSAELTYDERMPSVENDETKGRQVESNLDIASEDLISDSDSSDYYGEGDEEDQVVDIETIEEAKQGIAIAQMKEAVRKALKESGDSSDGFGSARELKAQDKVHDEHDQCKDKRRRKNHTVLERQRRSEQRILFDRLQIILKSDPRAPRLRLLSLAVKEIQNLVETSRCLEEKKKRLTQMQSLYVQELSSLSGKSDTLIKNKLKEICERQKIREKKLAWKPFFSHLLQSRAALLQSITPQSKPPPKPLLQPDFIMAPSQVKPTTVSIQNKVMSLLQPIQPKAPALFSVQTPMPQPVSTPAQVACPAPPPQSSQTKIEGQQETLKEIPGAEAQVSKPISQTECKDAAPLLVTTAQDGASPASSKPCSSKPPGQPPGQPPQPISLPLIRSKTGRIILPSSLKPIGHGFYTLMLMKPKEEDEVSSSAKTQPSDVDSSMNQVKSLSENDHPLNSGSSQDNKSAQSSNSKPKYSGGTVSLADLALLNKSIFMPSVTLQDVEKSREGSAILGLNKKMASACLSLQRVKWVPTSAGPDPTPPVVPRRRGRPRKHPLTPVGANKKPTVVEDTRKSISESKTSVPVKEKITTEVTKTQANDSPGMVSDNPVPVKRGRGRPPKKKTATLWRPPVVRGGSSPSKSNEDSPVRLSRSFKSPVSTSRPLTRGALGKDFPSAKKRSWIDVEKELEPDLESESEAESE